MYPVTLRLILFKNVLLKGSMEISTYLVTLILRLYQKFFTERVHGNFHVSCNVIETNIIKKCFTKRVHGNFHVPSNIETNSKMFLLKVSMDISMYLVILRLIQKCFIPTYKWSMEISTYPVTLILRLYQKFFTERVHGNFHVSCNIETNSEILYQKGPWKFPCTVPSNIETNLKMFLLQGSMEISMYPVILRLTHKFFKERVHENVRVSCNIETNSEICY